MVPVPLFTALPVPTVVSLPGVSSTAPLASPVRTWTVNWSDAANRLLERVFVTEIVAGATFLISHEIMPVTSSGIVTWYVPFEPVVGTASPSEVVQLADLVYSPRLAVAVS